jgi:Rrf2 family protein
MPKKFLEAILLELKHHGILQSKKGKGGGYALAKPAEAILFGDIVRLFDGPLALIPCVSRSLNHRCRECTDEETTGIRILFKEVRDATAQILDNTSLAKVCRVQEEVAQQKKPMYFI